MRIMVFGAGPIGRWLALRLHQAGKDVTLLARGETYVSIQKDGVALVDREWAAAQVETERELHLVDSVDGATREFVAQVRQRLEAKLLPKLEAEGADPDLILEAMDKRFEEVRLYQLRRSLPGLLPKEQRPKFQDPDWDRREDPVPVWVTAIHLMFVGGTIIANAPNPADQSILKRHFGAAVSPKGLLLAALVPTAILWFCFALL